MATDPLPKPSSMIHLDDPKFSSPKRKIKGAKLLPYKVTLLKIGLSFSMLRVRAFFDRKIFCPMRRRIF